MIDLFKAVTQYLASGVEGCAALLIAIAAIQATVRAIIVFFRKSQADPKVDSPTTEDVRVVAHMRMLARSRL